MYERNFNGIIMPKTVPLLDMLCSQITKSIDINGLNIVELNIVDQKDLMDSPQISHSVSSKVIGYCL